MSCFIRWIRDAMGIHGNQQNILGILMFTKVQQWDKLRKEMVFDVICNSYCAHIKVRHYILSPLWLFKKFPKNPNQTQGIENINRTLSSNPFRNTEFPWNSARVQDVIRNLEGFRPWNPRGDLIEVSIHHDSIDKTFARVVESLGKTADGVEPEALP